MHGLTPSIFSFSGFSAVVPYGTLEVQARLLRLRLLGDTRRKFLEHTWCYLVSIPSYSSALDFPLEYPLRLLWAFSGTLSCRVLIVLRHALLAYYGISLELLLDSLLLREILFSGRSLRPHKRLGPGLMFWERVIYSSFPLHCLLKNCLACSRRFENLKGLISPL